MIDNNRGRCPLINITARNLLGPGRWERTRPRHQKPARASAVSRLAKGTLRARTSSGLGGPRPGGGGACARAQGVWGDELRQGNKSTDLLWQHMPSTPKHGCWEGNLAPSRKHSQFSLITVSVHKRGAPQALGYLSSLPNTVYCP